MEMTPYFEYSAASCKGGRESNQDNLRLHTLIPRIDPDYPLSQQGSLAAEGTMVFAVCDGIGGALMGGVASELALEAIRTALEELPDVNEPSLVDLGRLLAEKAHQRVLGYYQRLRQTGGTTITLLIVRGDLFLMLNVGDSPAFHLHRGEETMEELTLRHNMAGYKKLKGIEPQPGDSSLLLCFLGDPVTAPSDVATLSLGTLQEGDRILLCSDGITNAFTEEELKTRLLEDCSAGALTDQAAAIEYADNCTALLLTYRAGG